MGNILNNLLIVLGMLDIVVSVIAQDLTRLTLGMMEILAGMQGRELNKLRNE